MHRWRILQCTDFQISQKTNDVKYPDEPYYIITAENTAKNGKQTEKTAKSEKTKIRKRRKTRAHEAKSIKKWRKNNLKPHIHLKVKAENHQKLKQSEKM